MTATLNPNTTIMQLSPAQFSRVVSERVILTMEDAAVRFAEFFSEVARSSAHIVVDFVSRANVKAFALLDQSFKAGRKLNELLRERGRTAVIGGIGSGGGGGGKSSGGGRAQKNTNAVGNNVRAGAKPMAIIPGLNGPNGPGGARREPVLFKCRS